jgi:hypothetical protein
MRLTDRQYLQWHPAVMRVWVLDHRYRSALLRWMLAVLAAPLVGAIASLFVPGGVYAILFGLPLSYPLWIAAVPLFVWFQRRHVGVALYPATGAVLGMAAWALLVQGGGVNRAIPGFHQTADLFSAIFLFGLSLIGSAIMGAVSGLAFWLIAIRPARH